MKIVKQVGIDAGPVVNRHGISSWGGRKRVWGHYNNDLRSFCWSCACALLSYLCQSIRVVWNRRLELRIPLFRSKELRIMKRILASGLLLFLLAVVLPPVLGDKPAAKPKIE